MRVQLKNMPPLLRDILSEALAGESDIALVGADPDVVVARASGDEACNLAHEMEVSLVAIDPDSRHALVFAHGKAPIHLADISPTTIIAAIRSISQTS